MVRAAVVASTAAATTSTSVVAIAEAGGATVVLAAAATAGCGCCRCGGSVLCWRGCGLVGGARRLQAAAPSRATVSCVLSIDHRAHTQQRAHVPCRSPNSAVVAMAQHHGVGGSGSENSRSHSIRISGSHSWRKRSHRSTCINSNHRPRMLPWWCQRAVMAGLRVGWRCTKTPGSGAEPRHCVLCGEHR